MRNPIRRSKKIGKTQGGRVRDGRAHEKVSRAFTRSVWERLSEESDQLRVLRENPSGDFFHPCSRDDYLEVLERLPQELTSPVKAIVLRRTSKRDLALGIEAARVLSCVVLNAFPRSRLTYLGGRPDRAVIRHYAPWCLNLDWIAYKGWAFHWSLDEVRRYYQYHLLLHEIGHFHQPDTSSVRRSEEFAENFALEWARRLGELKTSYEEAEDRLWRELERKDQQRNESS